MVSSRSGLIIALPSELGSGTVISIHENAYPNHDASLSHDEQKNLDIIRRNLTNVFCQISNASESNLENPIDTLPIRSRSTLSNSQPHASPADVPSLLFYYLFDDWYTSYSLVARKEHQYGAQLELLVSHLSCKMQSRLMRFRGPECSAQQIYSMSMTFTITDGN